MFRFSFFLLVDDDAAFRELRNALTALQFSSNEQDHLFAVVASLLHLGNLFFEGTGGSTEGSAITADSRTHLTSASNLLSIDEAVSVSCGK